MIIILEHNISFLEPLAKLFVRVYLEVVLVIEVGDIVSDLREFEEGNRHIDVQVMFWKSEPEAFSAPLRLCGKNV